MMLEELNRTKIVATIGPASSSALVLEQLILAGVNVCRINSSHGTHQQHKENIANIREINKKHGLSTGILVDLQGPKLRVGQVENDAIELHDGKTIIISTESVIGSAEKIFVNYPQLPMEVNERENILLDDGKIVLQVLESDFKTEVKCMILAGGILSSRKGVNLPDTKISLPSLSDKDHADLQFALDENVDWIGLSFVRKAADIVELKKIVKKSGRIAKIIAKIEKPEALAHLDEIISAADGLMVARGDLGIETDMAHLPHIQKMIIKKCLKASKPVIVATQMMESMLENYAPSRAEVNDVANAVLDGADAVMLSGETSVGKHPLRVVQWMKKIVSAAEEDENIYDLDKNMPKNTNPKTFMSKVICYNATKAAQHVKAKAIITNTHSGYTAFKVSSYRPKAEIIVFTDNADLMPQLSLLWGVRPLLYDQYAGTDETITDLKAIIKEKGWVKEGDFVVNIASMPIQLKGRANMLKLSVIE